MDVLSDVLRSVRLRSQVHGRLELTRPWGLRIDAAHSPRAIFYVIAQGNGWLEVEGSPREIALSAGDFVMLPRGEAHTVRDSPGSHALPVAPIWVEDGRSSEGVRYYGGGGTPAAILAGHFVLEGGAGHPLVAALPSVIHVASDRDVCAEWRETAMQFIAAETARAEPGADAVASRLAEILFVKALRAYLASDNGGSGGWLQALKDPQTAAALRLMHENAQQPWTVEALAERVAMSRSAFAERFARLVGEAPLGYLTRWRMQEGARLLREGDATLGAIARAVGYETESAFGKAFRRHMGASPGEYRKTLLRTERSRHEESRSPGSGTAPIQYSANASSG